MDTPSSMASVRPFHFQLSKQNYSDLHSQNATMLKITHNEAVANLIYSRKLTKNVAAIQRKPLTTLSTFTLVHVTSRYDEQFNSVMAHHPLGDQVGEWRLCNFFEHATCVAPLRNTDDLSEFNKNCLPSCDLTSIHQDGIHVSRDEFLSFFPAFVQYTRMDKALVDYFYRVAKAAMGHKIKNITELGKPN